MFGGVEWEQLLVPQTPLLEIVIRGSVMYLALYALLRFVRRDAGAISVNDLLVLVLIADAAQNGMGDDYRTIPDGLLLVGVIVGWAHGLNWLSYHVGWVERIVHPAAVPIIERGVIREDPMRRYLLTHEELRMQLRLQGVADPAEVDVAYVEGNGQISVLTSEHESRGSQGGPMPDSG